jgi:hypothetical protein
MEKIIVITVFVAAFSGIIYYMVKNTILKTGH